MSIPSRFIEADLDTIAEYIAQDNPMRAVSVREIRARFREVGKTHRFTSSRLKSAKRRIALVGRYAIMFRIDGDVVRMEPVVYGGRDLGGLDQEH